MEEIYNNLLKIIPEGRILQNEPMSKHTSFKIGGLADLFIKINTIEELKNVLQLANEKNIKIMCIGNGTNLLVKDNGIRGITIKLDFKNIEIKGNVLEVDAGVTLPTLARIACDSGLSGLEFATGIPGTVGGAIKMNAGAYGGEIGNLIISTTFLDKNLKIHTISKEEQKFSYRNSIFSNTNDYIIISTRLKLKEGDKQEIKAKMIENSIKRKEKQPIEYPSAGSIFKRKNEYIAAEIIDKCGLKGYNIKDAYVSEKHAGFIVNKGNATAKDVLELIDYIKKTVYKQYNINLELEIKVIGE